MTLQRRGRIAVERRPDRVREVAQVHRFGMQNAAAIIKVMHHTNI
jgi:hypothetical protein